MGITTWSSTPSNLENHPITCVDWGHARDFAVWAGGKLPTEAQWEYAARGGEDYEYPGSDRAGEVAWYNENANGGTRPVKIKMANGYGLYDMSGNVWEWVEDRYRPNHEAIPRDGRAVTRGRGGKRVIRGGGFGSVGAALKASRRAAAAPGQLGSYIGLRVARDLAIEAAKRTSE